MADTSEFQASTDLAPALTEAETSSRLYNADLAPATDRHWQARSLVTMWLSDVHSIGGYTFAAGLFFFGLVGWQVLIALIIGILLVNVGMNYMGYAGQQTGVPYPVLSRVSFGVLGSNIPALIRAIVAIAWYGIQTYLASVAVVVLALRVWPGLGSLTHGGFLGLSPLGWAAFMLLWLLQLGVMQGGMQSIRKYQDWAGPIIWVLMIILAVWIGIKAHGNLTINVSNNVVSGGDTVVKFLAAISLTVAYFSTLLCNFCDFSRFAPTKRAVRHGNFWGLPVNFTAFAILSVVVTSGTIVVYGKAITDPVLLVGKIHNTAALVVGAIAFIVATIGINIVANFVSPAYDLANVAPNHITFKRGGWITATIALVVLPWKLYSSPAVVNYFLGGLAAFLGPLFAIIMVDYYLVRRQRVDIRALYQTQEDAPYFYHRGVNLQAVAAFVPAAAIAAIVALVPTFSEVAPFSWFIGAFLGGGLYYGIARNSVSVEMIKKPA